MTVNKTLFLRRGFGLSQSYISSKLGISRPTLNKKEQGETDYTKTEMEILLNIFKKFNPNLTIEGIFFDDDFAKCEVNTR